MDNNNNRNFKSMLLIGIAGLMIGAILILLIDRVLR